jgi:hypothetical protein
VLMSSDVRRPSIYLNEVFNRKTLAFQNQMLDALAGAGER